ncbi:hypothetical protein ACFONN_09930 [Dyella humi]|uniref:Uncharacterized protein n=1 Tax=Dyella humi TaxID=1770547 RepID=A0ABW8ICV4_9GAMM
MSAQKPRRAVLVSVEREGDSLRVRLDDAECDVTSLKIWNQKEHVTNKLLPEESFREMNISDEELANFGAVIFARLNAFLDLGEA